MCRFINADDISYLDPTQINGLNLYAYCANNPVNYYDPGGHFPLSIIIGLVVGAAIGGAVAGIASYNQASGNGATGWELFGWTALGALGGAIIGGAIGAAIGYVAPSIGNFLGSTFSIGIPGLSMSGGALAMTTVTVTGAQLAGAIGLLAGLVMFSKGSGPRIGHNQYENKQFHDAMRKLGIKKTDSRWRKAHDAMDGSIVKYRELLEYIKKILGL